ncbi:hypothetical protein CF327_g2498 [Tilletia walkeri]|nr:hypothetical protein CF327_g2498 [Tilletia walkeri]
MARGASSNKRKADQGSGSSLKFSVKVPRRGVKKEESDQAPSIKTESDISDKMEPGVTVKKEQGADKNYAASESGTPSEYIAKVECFKPANPNGATLTEQSKPIRVNNGQRISTVRSTDSIEDFLNRMMPTVQRDIGGLPADWKIQVKVEGEEADLFKDFTLLE